MNFICLQQNVYLVDPVAKHVILRDAKLAVLDIFPIPQIMYKNVILALMDVIIVKQVMDKHVPHAHLVFIKKLNFIFFKYSYYLYIYFKGIRMLLRFC
jgi:hypothetical protein